MPFLSESHDNMTILNLLILPFPHCLPVLSHLLGEEFSNFCSEAKCHRTSTLYVCRIAKWAGIFSCSADSLITNYTDFSSIAHSCSTNLPDTRLAPLQGADGNGDFHLWWSLLVQILSSSFLCYGMFFKNDPICNPSSRSLSNLYLLMVVTPWLLLLYIRVCTSQL